MQYSFRLAELLGHVPDPRRRPGTIKAIVEYTGLDRHQVAALLKNEVKYIPLKALSRLCDYLIEHGHCNADQLPGALFAVEPENFWEMLARRRRLIMCVGVRKDVEDDSPDVSYVVASDSVLMGELLNGVTTLGGTAQLKRESASGDDSNRVPHPEHIKQMLVWSPGQIENSNMISQAEQKYREFSDASGDKALVCLGSTKSNPLCEIVMATSFGCDPFVSQDNVDEPGQRSCPVFFRYRDTDPRHASCAGGLSLAKGQNKLEPGIYYENAEGKWVSAGSNKKGYHVGMVFYVHRESQGRLEMALGGFSGRATRLLASALATRAEDFWEPTYVGQGMAVGIFLIEFNVGNEEEENILNIDGVATTRVVAVPAESIARRLGS